MIEFYLAMIVLTAAWVFQANRPRLVSEWLSLLCLSLLWPALLAWVVYISIKRDGK